MDLIDLTFYVLGIIYACKLSAIAGKKTSALIMEWLGY